jgi:hypothetical protein
MIYDNIYNIYVDIDRFLLVGYCIINNNDNILTCMLYLLAASC